MKLVCHAISPALSDERYGWMMSSYEALTPSGWRDLLEAADGVGLLPAWQVALEKHGLVSIEPDAVRDIAEATLLLNRDRNRTLAKEAEMLSAHLRAYGIQTVFLKGMAHILGGTYDDVGIRMTSDLDCLVHPTSAREAVLLLAEHGYEFAVPLEALGPIPGEMTHHAPPLYRKGLLAQVEIHFGFGAEDLLPFNMEDVLFASFPAKRAQGVLVPSNYHAASMSLAHAFLRRPNWKKTLYMRDFLDFLMLAKKDETLMPRIETSFQRTKASRELSAFTLCCDEFFGCEMGIGSPQKNRKYTRKIAIKHIEGRFGEGNKGRPNFLAVGLIRWSIFLATLPRFRRHIAKIFLDEAYRKAWLAQRRYLRGSCK